MRKAIINLRILASVLYEMIRKNMNHQLPIVLSHQQQLQEHQKLKKDSTTSGKESANNSTDIMESISLKHEENSKTTIQENIKKGIVGGLLKVLGVADTTPGYEDFQQGSLEFQLLRPRQSSYETMTALHMLLYSSQSLSNIHSYISDWAHEMLPQLNIWVNNIVAYVLQQQYQRRIAALQSPRPTNPS